MFILSILREIVLTKGKIISFVDKKNYGFIKGDDGESYFFHTSFLKEKSAASELAKGVRVEFDPAPAKKGLEARSLIVTQSIQGKRFRKFIRTDKSTPNDGIIERSQFIKTKAFKDLNKGREHLKALVDKMGGNALLDYRYEKSTRMDGNYRYSVHSFSGNVAVVSETVSFSSEVDKSRAELILKRQIEKFDSNASDVSESERVSANENSGCRSAMVVIVIMIILATSIAGFV